MNTTFNITMEGKCADAETAYNAASGVLKGLEDAGLKVSLAIVRTNGEKATVRMLRMPTPGLGMTSVVATAARLDGKPLDKDAAWLGNAGDKVEELITAKADYVRVKEKVIPILQEQLALPESSLADWDDEALQKELVKDMGADSFDILEIAIALDDEFNIDISDEEIAPLKTVHDVISLVLLKTK